MSETIEIYNNIITIETEINETTIEMYGVIQKNTITLNNGFIRLEFTGATTNGALIGTIPNGSMISHCILEVTSGGLGTANVGTTTSQGLLLTVFDNDLSVIGAYQNTNNLKLTSTTEYNLYLTNNTASGSITIYYN